MKKCLQPRLIRNKKNGELFSVPCGKCLNCLSNDQRDWVFRLKLENECFQSGIFVTLTYNDENLEPLSVNSVQKFIKRLRKRFDGVVLRFFYVGEYGRLSNRQHYHLIIFGLPIKSLNEGLVCVQECWNKGFCYVKWVNNDNIHYITKYLTKLDPRHHDVRPFVVCPSDLLSESLFSIHIQPRYRILIGCVLVIPAYLLLEMVLNLPYLDISNVNTYHQVF